jgi:hypothetical protein
VTALILQTIGKSQERTRKESETAVSEYVQKYAKRQGSWLVFCHDNCPTT